MAYWQISAGSEQREYHDVFIKYGIAFIGEEKAMNVMADDILVLKKGVSSIVAVGRVVSRLVPSWSNWTCADLDRREFTS